MNGGDDCAKSKQRLLILVPKKLHLSAAFHVLSRRESLAAAVPTHPRLSPVDLLRLACSGSRCLLPAEIIDLKT
jgi:hypothetical protein